MQIRTPDQRLRVFVSSTLDELGAERAAARDAIEQLRLLPVMFEAGARPHPPRELYRAYLEQSDVFVGIYWERYGWVGPDMAVSGLEDEFRLARGLPRLLYVKTPAPGIEPGLGRMLDQIRADGRVSFKGFADTEQLRELLLNDLAALLSERFGGDAERQGPGYLVPAPATQLVGREEDLRELTGLVRAEGRRLVVLTGSGGIGKTRLALAVLEETRGQWRDGAAFVDLSPVGDDDPRLAAWLTGANAAARDDIGIVPWPAITEAERRVTERIQGQLPADEYGAQAAAGRSATVQAAIAQALAILAPSGAAVTS